MNKLPGNFLGNINYRSRVVFPRGRVTAPAVAAKASAWRQEGGAKVGEEGGREGLDGCWRWVRKADSELGMEVNTHGEDAGPGHNTG